jgi:amino acid adenylation domain-containing protein
VETRHRGARAGFKLSEELTEGLKELSRREGVTQFMVLLAAFQSLLGRYANQDDVLVGTDVANRNRHETEDLIGFFVNQLVLRANLSGNPSFKDLLGRVRESALEALAYQDLPFEKIVEELSPDRDLGRSPLFQVKLAFQDQIEEPPHFPGLQLSTLQAEATSIKLAMNLMVRKTAHQLAGSLHYATDLFDSATAKRVTDDLVSFLQAVTADPEQRIGEIALLTAGERQCVLLEWNQTERSYEQVRSVHESFEEQVERAPDRLSVVYEDQQLSYGVLNSSANRLAHYLRKLGVGPDIRVALCMERRPEMVVGLLGVIKAGGAYVPLDPNYPADRLAQMLEDSQAALVLTQKRLRDKLPAYWALAINVDSDAEEWLQESPLNPAIQIAMKNLVYVIYTSGSTGRPKGVAIAHEQLMNYVNGIRERLELEPGWRMAMISTLVADLGYTALFPSLCFGGEFHLIQEECGHDHRLWEEYQEQRQIDFAKMTPSHLEALMRGSLGMPRKELVLGGEACSPELVKRVLGWSRGCVVVNHYGPTECTVGVVTHLVKGNEGNNVPIGKPLPNTRVYVLDGKLQPMPAKGMGELYVGGAGVARGYLRDPALTGERFVPDGLSGIPGSRLYRTGDRVRWRPDGELEYAGRIDRQVKLRGFRIELGEIETALSGHPGVRQCLVCMSEDNHGEKRLVAYIVPSDGSGRNLGDLRVFMLSRVPRYMIPSAFVTLAKLPLTPNGKVDRNALPAPDIVQTPAQNCKFDSAVEEILAGIWGDLLHREYIGRDQDFFELGGHSLLTTQLVSRIREVFQLEVPLVAVFDNPTIASLAKSIQREIDSGEHLDASPIVPASRGRDVPLSFAQQRLWFIHQLEPFSPTYNTTRCLRLQGPLHISVLRQSLRDLVARHEVLRTRFECRDGKPYQVIGPCGDVSVPICDVSDSYKPEQDAREIASRAAFLPFDLELGPVWRAALLRLAPADHVLLLCIHHIASDGWSTSILISELTEIYEASLQGRSPFLPDLPIQYADFAIWQRNWMKAGVLERQLQYWKEQLAGAPDLLELPMDHLRSASSEHRGGREPFIVSDGLFEKLRVFSRQENATLFMTLLAAFQVLLHSYSGQTDIVVGTDIANRNRRETEGLIGFFVNQLVIRTDLSGNPTFRELLMRVRKCALGAYMRQDLPFERLVEELNPERRLSHSPIFQAKLVLQNAPRPSLSLSGLELTAIDIENAPTSKYDLLLTLAEGRAALRGEMEYNADVFSALTIRRFLDRYETVMNRAVLLPDTTLDELNAFLIEKDSHQADLDREQLRGTVLEKYRKVRRRVVNAASIRKEVTL